MEGLKIGLVSLGCNKNRVDSEIALGLLQDHGCSFTPDPAQADILMVNTCGFIGPAKEESIDTILEMAQYKQTGHCRLLVVTGCLAQRYEQALMDDMPEIDVLLGVNQYDRLPAAIARALETGERVASVEDPRQFYEHRRILTTPSYSAYVRIGEGCSNRCTFCAIPLIRGNYRSRNASDILNEVRSLASRGVTEHVLVAQDTTRYGTDQGRHTLLPELMRQCADIEGVHWLRVLYCYPDETNEALLDLMATHPHVCPYLDLPIQHIDDDILRRMHRRGTSEDIRRCVRLAHERNITLRTSIIVGFPGETEDQFNRLMDFLEEAQFDRLGAFAYSPEEGTPAADMPDQVPEEIKQERLDRLMTLQSRISLSRNQQRVGTRTEVLVTGQRDGCYLGRSVREAPETDGEILFTSSQPLQEGTYVQVSLDRADTYDMWGTCL